MKNSCHCEGQVTLLRKYEEICKQRPSLTEDFNSQSKHSAVSHKTLRNYRVQQKVMKALHNYVLYKLSLKVKGFSGRDISLKYQHKLKEIILFPPSLCWKAIEKEKLFHAFSSFMFYYHLRFSLLSSTPRFTSYFCTAPKLTWILQSAA